jgi:lipopolysaccharide/colanic/teichoic acid biosynthesis glycosyltransferase
VPPAAAARPPRAPSPDEPRHARGRDTLPANDFLQHLRRETRRSMRSAGPLSIALYRLTGDGAGAGLDDAHVLEMLHMAKRETDILGHLGDDVLAVLCPDTGQDGIRAFVRKIGLCGAPGSALDVVAATFPDPVFERLLEPGAGWPARRPGDGLAAAPVAPRDGYLGKRALDVAGALVALALVWPVMLVVAILVAASSPGPVIFRQTRLGRGARPFVFYKFRSMTADAADDAHRSFATRFVRGAMDGPAAAGAAPFKLARDPRVTRIGAFLRRSSLDELPQFFNVLRGDMSLVGPRPPIPYEVECYQPWHLRRILGTRPGITGLWQVEGRSRVTFDAMVRMDLRYIRECSLLLDLKILARTVLVVLRADGAA